MTPPVVPEVDCEQQHTSLPVSDVLAAVDYYTKKLGFRLGFTWGDPPSMAGVMLDKVQMFLEQGDPNPRGCTVYFVVGNADELFEFQRANGVDDINCSTRGRLWRSSARISRCAWRSVSPRCSATWPSTSA